MEERAQQLGAERRSLREVWEKRNKKLRQNLDLQVREKEEKEDVPWDGF